MTYVGTVAGLHRYPVKSMLGETLQDVMCSPSGFDGDRMAALIDTNSGKVVTAKLPHRWRKMLELSARKTTGGDISVTLPGQEDILFGSAEADAVLSRYLSRDVAAAFKRPEGLEFERAHPQEVVAMGAAAQTQHDVMPLAMAAPDGGFFDFAPIHFVTQTSLDYVGKHLEAGQAQAERFRPNIIIQTDDGDPFIENGWVDGTLSIGAQLRLKVILPTPRCAVPTLAHGALANDRTALQCITQENKQPILDMGNLACLGAYAQVSAPGPIQLGDKIRFEPGP
ncbi:MAG: MOSC N-terminal beta barrel domain-containing protein [Pseudomonadota bacterium]